MTDFLSRHIAKLSRFAEAYRVRRDRARTERALSELPLGLRKDIGWPDAFAERISRAPAAKRDAEGFLARTACPLLFREEPRIGAR